MIKKTILITLFLAFVCCLSNIHAQALQQIAVINSNEILEAMPDKMSASEKINELNQKYKDELTVMQNDYNKKYSDFISYQTSMAENIRLRRMQELYELERHINEFMKVAQQDIESKEKELLEPLQQRLRDAIQVVGIEKGYTCIYDLANPAIAFVTLDAIDASPFVKQKLGIK